MNGVLSTSGFLSATLARQGGGLRAELQRATTEMTTGQQADPARALGGNFQALSALDHSLARLTGYDATTTEAALTAETMQTALGVIIDGADAVSASLMRNSGLEVPEQLGAILTDGARQFETTLAMLNTRLGDRAVFGGTVAELSPLPEADVLLAALETAISGAVTVDDVQTAIDGFFDDPAGYGALYQGGPARAPLQVAEGEVADLAFTAMDPAIRDTLKGLATIALLDRGALAGQAAARADLARLGAERILSSGEARAVLAARVGTEQGRIQDATVRNAAEKTALGIARTDMLSADPYETAARLQDLQTRLDALYVLTARLSGLSLTEYLR